MSSIQTSGFHGLHGVAESRSARIVIGGTIPVLSRLIAGCCQLLAASAVAGTIHLNPGGSFESAVESLQPGDTLIVHAGSYDDSGRISITVKGTSSQPVVIQRAEGEARPLIARQPTSEPQNTINIEGASHLTVQGLEITSNGGDGINMSGGPSYITLDNLVIHGVDVGINFRSSMHHIKVRRNEIFDTGGPGFTGEGMYVGCNYAECAVSESLIEGNYIHDTTTSDQGDGIEIKRGSHSNIVRDNVIHDTNYPCILVYGTEGNPRNVIERNVMWNCGDSGIQAAADAVIRNNIIIPGDNNGLNSQDHQGVTPNNLEFINNTVYGGNACLRLSNWGNKQGMIFANNAVFCPANAFAIGSLTGVQIAGNVFAPAPPVFPAGSYTLGRSAALDLQDAANLDVYPTADSLLRGAGNASFNAADDFNGTSRTGSSDAGAYVYTAAGNPGWAVGPRFKGVALPLTGTSGADNLIGTPGIDSIDGLGGADIMTGLAGNDTYYVQHPGDVVVEEANEGTDTVRSSVSYSLPANVENLTLNGSKAINGTGNSLVNTLTGNSASNTLSGRAGKDTLRGRSGNDKLVGGPGSDRLQGDAGADTFVFNAPPGPGNVDRIIDFSVGEDTIRLASFVFPELAPGALAPGALRTGTAAGDADDRIVYNSVTGALFYDSDGSGSVAPIRFSTLAAGLVLTSTDFVVQ